LAKPKTFGELEIEAAELQLSAFNPLIAWEIGSYIPEAGGGGKHAACHRSRPARSSAVLLRGTWRHAG
jgi:hypothetical protein